MRPTELDGQQDCGWINRTSQKELSLIHMESDVRVLESKVTEDNDQLRTMFSARPQKKRDKEENQAIENYRK